MKFKIKPFLYSLIRENLFYIILFILLFILIIFILITGSLKINKTNLTIKELTSDINSLKKQSIFYNIDDESKSIIETDIKILNMLIPSMEDYFSIIYALERLSNQTGFIIVSYNIDLKLSTTEKLRLTVSGVGDGNSFLNFLENYNFGGGRLITSDKIEYDVEKSGVTKLNLTFYSKNAKKTLSSSNYNNQYFEVNELLKNIEKIKSKISFDLNYDEEQNVNYPKNSNPFE